MEHSNPTNYLPPWQQHYTEAESQEAGVVFEPQEV